jgi:hypothetical protein
METITSYLRWSLRTQTVEYVMPPEKTEIVWAEFRHDPRLKSVLLSTELTIIGDRAFAHCPLLHSVEMPCPHLYHLGEAVFKGCVSLKHLDLSVCKHIRHLPPAFAAKCRELKTCVLPPYLETIGECAFAGCEKLESVRFPSTLVAIQSGAFQQARSLHTVQIPASLSTLGNYAFAGCRQLKSVVFADPRFRERIFDDNKWECVFIGCPRLGS